VYCLLWWIINKFYQQSKFWTYYKSVKLEEQKNTDAHKIFKWRTNFKMYTLVEDIVKWIKTNYKLLCVYKSKCFHNNTLWILVWCDSKSKSLLYNMLSTI